MTIALANEKSEQLLRDGYCLFEQVMDRDLLERVREVSDQMFDAQPAEHFEQQKSTGSMINIHENPFFAELVSAEGALASLAALGFDKPKWWSGFIISKPPHSPPLFWHQDWWGWNDEISYTWDQPQQAFLMWYLQDTTQENGCLRLIKGSHRKRHVVHEYVPDAHTAELRRMADPDHPAYQCHEDEVEVTVKAGDLVIGDSRLLHSAHANKTNQRRTVITLWYFPTWDELSEPIRAHIANRELPESWKGEAMARLESLVPAYNGDAGGIEWNRIPGERLQ
ncbi:MAG: phytanoyl-CoA dioxygenase family protein [Candidatus Latescibacterota bacterium]|nr:phytanoyl-CoA dioxygenase family protein [Candidatus Latescibacterota bacterium]